MPPHPPSGHVTKKNTTWSRPHIKTHTTHPRSKTMASRHSRRLQGLGPEHLAYEDRCFICLLDLEVHSLKRCQATPCCGKFVHKRCFAKKPAKTVTNADTADDASTCPIPKILSVPKTTTMTTRSGECLPNYEDQPDIDNPSTP